MLQIWTGLSEKLSQSQIGRAVHYRTLVIGFSDQVRPFEIIPLIFPPHFYILPAQTVFFYPWSSLSVKICATIFIQICYTNLPLLDSFHSSQNDSTYSIYNNICANLYNKIEDDFFKENCIYKQQNTNLLWCTERTIPHGSQTLPFPLYLKQIIITMKVQEICSFLIKSHFLRLYFRKMLLMAETREGKIKRNFSL